MGSLLFIFLSSLLPWERQPLLEALHHPLLLHRSGFRIRGRIRSGSFAVLQPDRARATHCRWGFSGFCAGTGLLTAGDFQSSVYLHMSRVLATLICIILPQPHIDYTPVHPKLIEHSTVGPLQAILQHSITIECKM